MSVPARGHPGAQEFLTADQEATLRAAGSFVDQMPALEQRASSTTVVRLDGLVATALTTKEAAERLGVTERRVRRRIAKRTLLAIKVGGRYRLPAFQFTHTGELPGFDRLAAVFPAAAHPTAIAWFMQAPNVDLVVGEDVVAPSVWLAEGGDLTTVLDLIATGFGSR